MRNLYIFILLCIAANAFSQYYPREAGLRGGFSSGVTFRVNINEELSYEAQLCYRHQGGIFTIFRQNHLELGMDRGGVWELVYGMGVHAGFYFTDSYSLFNKEIYYGYYIFTPVVGVDGYAGIDYLLEEVPMGIGISFQPHMEISMRQIFGINLWDFGVHVNYRF